VKRLLLAILVLSACGRGERAAPATPPRASASAESATTPDEASPRPEPTPASEAEQRARCLSYTVERETLGESRRVKVRVRNTCSVAILAEQTRFEITATPLDGQGVIGRTTGSFQKPIPPNSESVETSIEVDCPSDVGGCRYFVTAL
jgi:hypothetical protein